MRRELKFRGWNINLKRMENDLSVRSWLFHNLDQSSESVIMQYTSLDDKNGKEIYEGDILKTVYPDVLFVVEFKRGEFICEKGIHIFGRSLWEEAEIIGNIYENPDLIVQQPKEQLQYNNVPNNVRTPR